MSRSEVLVFDMDGVLYDSDEPIPGSAETLAWVRNRKIPHLFVTNTTSRGREAIAIKLRQFGIPAESPEIMTPCEAAADWLRSRGDGGVALFVRPAARGKGYGRALLVELAKIARERGCGRMEWAVLDWNDPAIQFYRKLGAEPKSEWTVFRLTHDGIARLAQSESVAKEPGRLAEQRSKITHF